MALNQVGGRENKQKTVNNNAWEKIKVGTAACV